MRVFVWGLVAGLAVPLWAGAQAPEPTLRMTTSEVLLDVVVRDKHEHIIRDLRPGEVKVFENGVEQPVRHFGFVDGRTEAMPQPIQPVKAVAAPLAASVSEPTVNELRDMSVVSIVIADLDPRGRKLTEDAINAFLKDELQPRTYVGVFWLGMGGMRTVQNYTDNAGKISAAVQRIVKRVDFARPNADEILPQANNGTGSTDTEVQDPQSGNGAGGASGGGGANSGAIAAASGPAAAIATLMEAAQTNEMHDVYQGSMQYLLPLQALVRAQAQIPGRKVVLFFSSGLPVHADTAELLQNVISTANRSNVTVYCADTRDYTSGSDMDSGRRWLQRSTGASRRQQTSIIGGDQTVTPFEAMSLDLAEHSIHQDVRGNMRALAEGTGGELLPPTMDMREPLRRAMEDVRTHYEIAYSPTNSVTDGSFRKIEVRVTRPGAKIFARSGYYALPVLNGRAVYPFEMATLGALNAKPQPHQFVFRTAAMQFRPGPEKVQMEYVFQSAVKGLTVVKEGQWVKVHLGITALVKDENGAVVEKISKDIPYEVPANKAADLERGLVSFSEPFSLPPGHYVLETAAVDRQSGKVSATRSALVVQESSGLAVSDVTLVRRVDPKQGTQERADPLRAQGGEITPELSEVVNSQEAESLRLYAVAYPPAPVDAPVETGVQIWRDGRLVMRSAESKVQADGQGVASLMVSLPTAKFPAGQYEAQLSFEYKGQTVRKTVPFILEQSGGTIH